MNKIIIEGRPVAHTPYYDMMWYDMMRCDMMWYDAVWYDMIWYDAMWYDVIWCDMIWYDAMCYDVMWYEGQVQGQGQCRGWVNVYTTGVGSLLLCYDGKSNNNVTASGRSLSRWGTNAQPSEGKNHCFTVRPLRLPRKLSTEVRMSKTFRGRRHLTVCV